MYEYMILATCAFNQPRVACTVYVGVPGSSCNSVCSFQVNFSVEEKGEVWALTVLVSKIFCNLYGIHMGLIRSRALGRVRLVQRIRNRNRYLIRNRRNVYTERHTHAESCVSNTQQSVFLRHHGSVPKLLVFVFAAFPYCVVNEVILWSVNELHTARLGGLSDSVRAFPRVPENICRIDFRAS